MFKRHNESSQLKASWHCIGHTLLSVGQKAGEKLTPCPVKVKARTKICAWRNNGHCVSAAIAGRSEKKLNQENIRLSIFPFAVSPISKASHSFETPLHPPSIHLSPGSPRSRRVQQYSKCPQSLLRQGPRTSRGSLLWLDCWVLVRGINWNCGVTMCIVANGFITGSAGIAELAVFHPVRYNPSFTTISPTLTH